MATKNGAAGPSKRQSSAKRIGMSFCASAAPDKSVATSKAMKRMKFPLDERGKSNSLRAGTIPAVELLALLAGEAGEVARRHRPGKDGLLVNLHRQRADALRRIELHALGRFGEARQRRLFGVAGQASLLDDSLHLFEADGRALRYGSWGNKNHRDDHKKQSRSEHPGLSRSPVALNEPDADQGAGERQGDEQQPGPAVAKARGRVARNHGEHHGQREASVVHTALLAEERIARVGLASRLHRLDHSPLAGNDDVPHVAHHEGTEHRTEMDERAAAAEHLRQAPSEQRGEHQKRKRQYAVVFSERRTADGFIRDR